MPYTGPGPAVIGQEAYRRALLVEERTAGGRIGSAVLDPVPDPIFEPQHADPVVAVEVEASLADLHVMKALRKIADTDEASALHLLLMQEKGRGGNGPRPTVLAALEAKLA